MATKVGGDEWRPSRKPKGWRISGCDCRALKGGSRPRSARKGHSTWMLGSPTIWFLDGNPRRRTDGNKIRHCEVSSLDDTYRFHWLMEHCHTDAAASAPVQAFGPMPLECVWRSGNRQSGCRARIAHYKCLLHPGGRGQRHASVALCQGWLWSTRSETFRGAGRFPSTCRVLRRPSGRSDDFRYRSISIDSAVSRWSSCRDSTK